ncbi:MAG: NAD+ synthase [Saprospiraceae bacterium]|nr:NAD+ synthase [Saprospiraceae bacterium]
MRIAVAQLNYHIGNFEGNLKKMLEAVETARTQKADIVCFAELATVGYPPRDFLEFEDFIELAEHTIEELCKVAKDIAIVIGSPSKNPKPEGKSLYNSAYFIADGKVQQVQHKALLPTYDIFDEYRYFEPASAFNLVHYKGKKIALTVCEDIWDVPYHPDGIIHFDPLYTKIPLDEVKNQGPDFVINVSASPFSFTHAERRLQVLKANCERYHVPFFYINHTGAQTEIIFDGGSVAMRADGTVLEEMPYFQEAIRTFELDDLLTAGPSIVQPKNKIQLIHDALVEGLKNYFQKLGFKIAILGLSGGIDSAVVAVLAARALGEDNVRVLLMPSKFSSDHSVNDARQLATNLGCQYDILSIESIYDTYIQTLETDFRGLPFGLAEENLQARIRGALLMAYSNKFGNILLNTTNKSEMAVGYGTLYGDLCGGLSVIGDVYKMEVYELARYMNKDGEIIPENIITKPPSAELRPDQKDTDSLPEYDELDPILFDYIERRMSPQEIIERGHDEATVRRVLRLVNINEFKRHQSAPVLRVSDKAFGMGRRMPIVGKYLS